MIARTITVTVLVFRLFRGFLVVSNHDPEITFATDVVSFEVGMSLFAAANQVSLGMISIFGPFFQLNGIFFRVKIFDKLIIHFYDWLFTYCLATTNNLYVEVKPTVNLQVFSSIFNICFIYETR